MEYERLAVEILGCMKKSEHTQAFKAFDVEMSGEAFILYYIEHTDGTVTPSQIGAAMNVTSARIAAALNALESKGLITREIDKTDRRKILVVLTTKGSTAANERKRLFLQKAADILRLLGEEDANHFVRIIKKLTAIPQLF